MPVLVVDGRNDIKGALGRILDAYSTRLDSSRGIVLKPNVVFPVHERSGEITRLAVVRTLVELLRERAEGVDIVLAEGVAAGCDPRENFRVSGYDRLSRELNVPLLDLHAEPRTAVPWKYGRIALPRIVLERCYINLPILKVSSACVLSGALKNQKGLVSPAAKKRFHREGLHEQIAALNAVVRPALSIMDCSTFLGRDVFVGGDNCGEIDAAACALLRVEQPEHVRAAAADGVFSAGFSTVGDTLDQRRFTLFPRPAEFKTLGRLRLWSNPQACSLCRYLFNDIRNNPVRRLSLFSAINLVKRVVVGAEVIMGMNPSWRREHRDVICVGDCTRSIARQNGYRHVPGCPPTSDDLLDRL
jgi:uncharacterized protein (DUF362 family)